MVWLGVACLVIGSCVAVAARRSPRRRRMFETVSGGLFLAGLGLVGAGFVLVA
ncbi:hypothetical protein [Methylobacterium aerolatum]|uniref:Uncharacterized protein n=1 Tax=Methylobacterium aerolatum TaxID=418708 RepID=A0ABU0I5H3_9HYPH|nr:hypothetical protein [Methylobacterium aerolatum]MDQ0449869.1 hypothetical protein [Methylobacterium aerolatum]GJD36636.1 hypothetical protein FMGBMHLM_3559 [Methylobacterium aerolatum]